MGTHMRVLSESFSMNTNMIGIRWFLKKRLILNCSLDESNLSIGRVNPRGLATMRPACHLDTQDTVFWQFGHPKVYVRICWRWLFLEDRRCRSCSVTFIRDTKQYLALKSKIYKGIGSILLVVCILYHTLDTQKSMKPLFGHPVSKYRLRPWLTHTISDGYTWGKYRIGFCSDQHNEYRHDRD